MSSAPCQVSTLSLGVDAEFELQGSRDKDRALDNDGSLSTSKQVKPRSDRIPRGILNSTYPFPFCSQAPYTPDTLRSLGASGGP